MTYELAKELKEAGFPQVVTEHTLIYTPFGELKFEGEIDCIAPTLSELIDACGPTHPTHIFYQFCLIRSENEWCAGYMDDEMQTTLPIEKGTTPEEAVARLWLALQK